jgi:transglutaminase-like putative cysteine protease
VRRAAEHEPSIAPTLVAFVLLAGYGTLRWATMLAHPPAARLAGLIALACAAAALGAATRAGDPRVAFAGNVAIVVAALAMLPLAGIPLTWIVHARIAVIARAIDEGLSTLPGVLVPYRGADEWTRVVIVLGDGMLLLGGALTLATSQRRPARGQLDAGGLRDGGAWVGAARLAGAALPLIVLAIVPAALATPRFAWLHGLVTFLLLALFVLRERIAPRRAGAAVALVMVAAVVAAAVAGLVGTQRPWVSVTSLASRLATGEQRFDWAQTYGPLQWPATGETVLTVRARFPAYWKAENLDAFNGRVWVDAPVGLPGGLAGVAPTNIRRWTQTLAVTLDGISTRSVIGAGLASPPQLAAQVEPGYSPGTYVTAAPLSTGDRYQVSVYAPLPTPSELAVTGDDYPVTAIGADLQIELPARAPGGQQPEIAFAPFGSAAAFTPLAGLSAPQQLALLQASPYGPVWRIAERLKARTTTPFQFVEAVERYLGSGFAYDQNTSAARYPLVTFLLRTRRGYCQQFAGAMALLLRMGGVPARVAVGFTTGRFDPRTRAYAVSDIDAHAWVEAWFPGYGWVQREATPAGDPALGGSIALTPTVAGATGAATPTPAPRTARGAAGAATVGRRPGSRRSPWWPIVVGVLAAILLAVLAVRRLRVRSSRPAGPDAQVAELEWALARCGEPAGPGATLAALERRFADAPEAAEYLRRLRGARYAVGGEPPTAAQRRAMRAALARGSGMGGRLRALRALPPLPRAPA